MAEEQVILVNEQDEEKGLCGKLLAHQNGLLHRAISVFIFNSEKKMLLQQRALTKYHSGGLWTNACCSHPRPGETAEKAAKRRLMEEMGLSVDELSFCFTFLYKVKLDNELTEHELDHVFIGQTDDNPEINPKEVAEWKYISMQDLERDLQNNGSSYTYWFKLIFKRIKKEATDKGFV